MVSYVTEVRTEGLDTRAFRSTVGKSHTAILRRETRLAIQAEQWSLRAPEGTDVTIEGDEVYTRIRKNFLPRSV